ncbi:MAG: class A beta-lactamase-related serine hydrolase [Gemmatimonadetes bacterium]|nr:class A beta-lactamase-related serine hydrolase [Gemmatimonadota bacterium]
MRCHAESFVWLLLAGTALQAQTPPAVRVDEIFQRWNRTDGPGAQVAVIRNGEIVLSRSYGMADLDGARAVGPHTTFDMASVSKQFTGFAIALLAEEGRLDLGDDVRKYLPELPVFSRPVTLRHLVHHTSGVRDWVELLYLSGFQFDDVWEVPEILTLARSQKRLNFDPGSEELYSNTGYNLLAETVARVSGIRFAEFLRTRVFEPLGMRDTHVHDDHTMITANWAASYQPREGGGYRVLGNHTAAVGSSSVISTAEDIARWLANLSTGQVGGGAVRNRIRERGVLNSGDTISYAFGVQVDRVGSHVMLSHGGSWRGFRSQVMYLPELELGVAVVGNTTEFTSASHARQVLALFLPPGTLPEANAGAGAPARDSTAAVPASTNRVEDFRGRFKSSELFDVTHDLRPADDGTLRWCIRRHGEAILRPVGRDRFRTMGVRGMLTFRFQRDRAGRVSGFALDGARFRGVEFQRDSASVGVSWCDLGRGTMR